MVIKWNQRVFLWKQLIFQSLPRSFCYPHFSAFPPFDCSCAHAVQLSKLILRQPHAFANLPYLPALTVIKKSVVLVQQVDNVHFQQFRNPAEPVFWIVVVFRVFIMNIGALVNPCIFGDFPLEQGFFISVIPQLVRRCCEHSGIGILDIELFGVGELLRTKKQKTVDCKRTVNRPSVSLFAEHIQAVADFEEQSPFWSVPGKGSFFFLLRPKKSRYERIGFSMQRAA